MSHPESLEITGDITPEIYLELAGILRREGYRGEIALSPGAGSSGFYPDYDAIVQTAAAIAAVIDMILNFKMWRRQEKEAQKSLPLERRLRKRLDDFKASDFEVISISDLAAFADQDAGNCTVVVRDIPSNRRYRIKASGKDKISIHCIAEKPG